MHNPGRRPALLFDLIVYALPLAIAAFISAPIQAQTHQQIQDDHLNVVLVLSFSITRPVYSAGISTFQRTLQAEMDETIVFHVEPIVDEAFGSPLHHQKYLELVKARYSGKRVDLVVYFDEPALEFMMKYGPEVFGQSPSMFCQVDSNYLAAMPTAPTIPGTTMAFDVRGSLRAILRIHPDTRHILVVSGSSQAVSFHVEQAREFAVGVGTEVVFEFTDSMSVESMLNRISSLPDRSIVYYLFIAQDITGRSIQSDDLFRVLLDSSVAPIYGILGYLLGDGIVGGLLAEFDDFGRQSALLGSSIIKGEIAADRAFYQFMPSTLIYDWRQLKRWGIDEERLPSGSIIRYREPTLWEEHRSVIIVVLVVVLVQSLLILALIVNVRKHRKAMHQLRHTETQYRIVADFAYDWEYWEGVDGRMIYVSPSFERITGYEKQKLLDDSAFMEEIILDEDIGAWEGYEKSRHQDKRELNIEFRIRKQGGEIRWIEHACQPVNDPVEGFLGYRASNRDITDRKLSEAARQESENKYESLVENANEMIIVSQDSYVKYFNTQVVKLTGCTAEDFASIPFIEFIHPDDRDTVLRKYGDRLSGKSKSASYTVRILTKSGDVISVLINSALIQWEDRPAILSMITDITEQKRSEMASAMLFGLIRNAATAKGFKEVIQIFMVEMAEFFDWEYAEAWVQNKDDGAFNLYSQWAVPDERLKELMDMASNQICPSNCKLLGKLCLSKTPTWVQDIAGNPEICDWRKEGAARSGVKSMVALPVTSGDEMLAMVYFLSRRRRTKDNNSINLMMNMGLQIASIMDRKLRAEEFEHTINVAPVAIVTVDTDGVIIFGNREAQRLLGLEETELHKISIKQFIAESGREQFVQFFSEFIENRQSQGPEEDFYTSVKAQNGQEFSARINMASLGTAHGVLITIGIIDLTRQQESYQKLREYSQRLRALTHHTQDIAEHERKSIARDLHDDMGQVLTALKMELSLLRRGLAKDTDNERRLKLEDEFLSINETIDSANDRLHDFIGRLRPEELDNLGLVTALAWQAEEFERRYSIRCDYISPEGDMPVDGEVAIAAFRITQECLTNVARHSKARNVKIKVDQVDNSLIIEVSDDGIGMSADTITSTKRFGLLGVKERASALGGNVKIESSLGKGTTVRTTVPLQPGELSRD